MQLPLHPTCKMMYGPCAQRGHGAHLSHRLLVRATAQRAIEIFAVPRGILTHVVQRYALFPLQDSFSLVAYVDVQLVYGSWFVSLCKPRASARKVLRDALMRIQRRADIQRRVVGPSAWCARQHVDPRVKRECLQTCVGHV